MRQIQITFIILMFITSCKENSAPKYGITFWSKNPSGEIVVTFDTTSHNPRLGLISVGNDNTPECGSRGSANFSYEGGTYAWEATHSTKSWIGVVELGYEKCTILELKFESVTFFTNDVDEEIIVTFNTNSNNPEIQSVTEKGVGCESIGNATFNYPPGNYYWKAKSTISEYEWDGHVALNEGSTCKLVELKTPGQDEDPRQPIINVWKLSSATLGSETITDLTRLTLIVDTNFGYTTNATSLSRQPNPWSYFGTFAFGTNSDGTANINQIIRDGEVNMDVTVSADGNIMTLGFTFDDDTHRGSEGGGEAIVDGVWFFEFHE